MFGVGTSRERWRSVRTRRILCLSMNGHGPTTSFRRESAPRLVEQLRPYLLALGCVAVSTLVALFIEPFSSLEDEAMIYLLADILAALRFDPKTSVVTAVGSILACDFLFVQPRMAFAWTDTRKSLTFLAMVVVAVVISGLSGRLRHQERAARRSAEGTKALYDLNVELAATEEPRELALSTSRRIEQLFGGEAVVLLGTAEGAARRFRGTAPRGFALWLPVMGAHGTLAVIGVKTGFRIDEASEEGLLLAAFGRELSAAIERSELANAARRAVLEAETERMRSSLLSAVSHDLKTPLAGIVATGSTLREHEASLDPRASRALVSTMVRESERIAQLLKNLLAMSRLKSGKLELRRTPEAMEDIVAAALGRLDDVRGLREVEVDVPADLPWVDVEPALVEQVLLNLLENALRYTPAGTRIGVAAHAGDAVVNVQVYDSGPGIAEREREKVFQEFFRGSRSNKRDGGVGLGLPICRAVVRAHGGNIQIYERNGGGALVEFTLPIAADVGEWPSSMEKVSA
jgi:two-component system, OmpR family, sensor histidine kinase KdpD